jgi:hypothetical protein
MATFPMKNLLRSAISGWETQIPRDSLGGNRLVLDEKANRSRPGRAWSLAGVFIIAKNLQRGRAALRRGAFCLI